MAYFKLKGIPLNYEVSGAEAKRLQGYFNDDTIPSTQKLEVGSLSFTKSQIQFIDVKDEKVSEKTLKFRENIKEHNEWWFKQIQKTAEEKADYNRDLYSFLQHSITGQFSFEGWEEMRGKTIKWFKENPKRTICDYRIWNEKPKSLVTGNRGEMKTELPLFSIRLLENQVAEDVRMSEKLHPQVLEKSQEVEIKMPF